MNKRKYTLDRRGILARIAMICMAAAMITRVIGVVPVREMVFGERFVLFRQLLLPEVSCLLFIACIFFFGDRALWTTLVPAVTGTLFLILRMSSYGSYDNIAEMEMPLLRQVISLTAYLIILVVYSATVFSGTRSKWIFTGMTGAALVYRAFEDFDVINRGMASFSSIMTEVSLLLMILGLIFAGIGMKNKKLVKEVSPESGRTVQPPMPGKKLSLFGKKQAGNTAQSAPAEETADAQSVSAAENAAPEANEPEIIEINEDEIIDLVPQEEQAAQEAEEPETAEAPEAAAEKEEPEQKTYDESFFEPAEIKLTLTPEKDSEEE